MKFLSFKDFILVIFLLNLNLIKVEAIITESEAKDLETNNTTVEEDLTENENIFNSTEIDQDDFDTQSAQNLSASESPESESSVSSLSTVVSNSKEIEKPIEKPLVPPIIKALLKTPHANETSYKGPLVVESRTKFSTYFRNQREREMKAEIQSRNTNPDKIIEDLLEKAKTTPLTKDQLETMKKYSYRIKKFISPVAVVSQPSMNLTKEEEKGRWFWSLLGYGRGPSTTGLNTDAPSTNSSNNICHSLIIRPRLYPQPGQSYYECPLNDEQKHENLTHN